VEENIKILLITNKTDITTDFIVKNLKHKEIPFYRLNTESLGDFVDIRFNFFLNKYLLLDKALKVEIDLSKIRSVYFRRPEITNISNSSLTEGEKNFIKSEILFTLEGLYRILDNAHWLNSVYDIRNAENKIYQLILAKNIGLCIPNSLITNNPSSAFTFYENNNSSCIIKPIKSGLIQGSKEEGVIFTNKVVLNDQNLARVESCPLYLQSYISKKGDIRVTVVGNELFAAFIDSQTKKESKVDWRKSVQPLKHSRIKLPQNIAEKCLLLTKRLNLNLAAIDFILDKENNFIFLEINPNGQWAWIEKQLNYPISDKIANIIIEKAIN